jgi:hypothetical protein
MKTRGLSEPLNQNTSKAFYFEVALHPGKSREPVGQRPRTSDSSQELRNASRVA